MKVIYFDIGDTLYFSEEMEKQYPQKLYEIISERFSISITEAKEKLKSASESLEGKIIHVTKVASMEVLGFTRAEVHKAFCSVVPSDYLKPDYELNKFLENLSNENKLGVISNFKKSHAIEIFEALKINPNIFTHYVTEDIVNNIKPDPEPFIKAVKLSGTDASKCIYVADSISKDLIPAKNVGMQTVWVNKKSLKEEHRKYVDYQVVSVVELSDVLN